MKNIVIKLLAIVFIVTFIFYLFYSPTLKFDVLENPKKDTIPNESIPTPPSTPNPPLEKGVGAYIGKNIDDFTNKFGYPTRIYPSSFSFQNFVYQLENQYYIIGVKNKKIVMVYGTGKEASINPFKVGEKASKIFNGITLTTEPVVKTDRGTYQFELSEVDVKTQQLIQYGDIFAQVYTDRITNKILAIKYLDADTLVELKPYAMSYKGEVVSNEQKDKDHNTHEVIINSNNVLTLFDLTNIMREVNGRESLETNEMINHISQLQVARLNKNKDQVKEVVDDIGKQLKEEKINYDMVAQNIGYNFEDVPAVMNSWMNADAQREHILNKEFNEMGGGIAGGYTSLVFIKRTGDQ